MPTFAVIAQALLAFTVGAVSEAQVSLIERNSIANGVDLRILPLGDSITWGFQSSTGDGYRQALLDLLPNNDVLYIGSQHSGSMDNNANEGWPGWHIQWLESKAELSLPEQPNVVLLMAGTNDMIYNDSIADAPARLGNLMDVCIAACPDAVLVVATLTPLHNPLGDTTGENKTLVYNAALPAVVKQRADAGSKVLLVDMQNPVDGLTIDELADGIHPDDEGYTKMADVWLDGLNNASSRGWITAPVDLAANSTSVNVTSSTAASSSVASPSIVSTATAASAQAKSSASATIVSTSSASINLPHLELRSVFVVVSTVLVSSCTLLC